VPDLVFSGSKPQRQLALDPKLHDELAGALRTYEDAGSYLPNRVFIGASSPLPLTAPERPWWNRPGDFSDRGASGRIVDQATFLEVLTSLDVAHLTQFNDDALEAGGDVSPILRSLRAPTTSDSSSHDRVEIIGREGNLGFVRPGYPGDESLAAPVVLENLATKATAAIALAETIESLQLDPGVIDLVISCSEEAVGDRYQRGGGNLGKAVAEAVGAVNASGFDVKNFCAAPIPALVVASSLIVAGVVSTVAVVAGGSLPKLGMKFEGHLRSQMPVLEDCLGGFACILSATGDGPAIRHDAVGRHSVAAGGSNQAIFTQLVIEPLESVGLKATDVDLFGTEMHNPELTEPQGSGDVPLRNYRMIGALAVKSHHIANDQLNEFLSTRCIAGFAPTQGHLASAICLLPLWFHELSHGSSRIQLTAKGSLFLGRMSELSDGMSVLIEG
jgi:betaine reductase